MRLADVRPAPRPKKGETCSVAKLRERLDPDDLKTFNAWLSESQTDMPSVEIARRLREAGATVNGAAVASGTISRHRRGDCQCGG